MIPASRRSLHLSPGLSRFLSPSRAFHPDGAFRLQRIWRRSMCSATTAAQPHRHLLLKDGVLSINGRQTLTSVPENVVVTPLEGKGLSPAFLGAVAGEKGSRHVFKLGVLRDYRLLCLFRFKIWWMIPRMGNSGRDIPVETQMLLLEAREDGKTGVSDNAVNEESVFYILFLPVLDGAFRSSLQGNVENELEFCIESGDPNVQESQFSEAVFVNSGRNPFDLMKESMRTLEKQKGTFTLRENKKIPGSLDWFGWCTWDAFYTDVCPQGIEDGLKSLSVGGTPPKFLIVDDGWQETVNEYHKEGEPLVEGSQFAARLSSIKENSKFKQTSSADHDEATNGLKNFISSIKRTFGLKYVYVWHALMGYWGGVKPDAPGTKKYNPRLCFPLQSPGNIANIGDIAMDSLEKYGVGIIDPDKIFDFYNDMHKYLASQEVDGVKVDVQNVIETLGKQFGGRVSLTRQYQQALEKSISENFRCNSLICCMGHNTDSIYSSNVSVITRASEDYMPREVSSQTLHVASVAFNSILLGEIFVPDWDMFNSLHQAAEFHAAARALGGCGVYVSDKPGQHDFGLLKKLVLKDGSVLRAKYPGRPTRDCLFNDPVMDGKSLLKIWNLNNISGVLGIFNCQGAGTWPFPRSNEDEKTCPSLYLAGHARPSDIEYLEEVAGKGWTGDSVVYSSKSGYLSRLSINESFVVSLHTLQCEVFTVSPIKSYSQDTEFAPIGLIEMYNSGGAVEAVDFTSEQSNLKLCIKGRGSGLFGAFSNRQPKYCTVNSNEVESLYLAEHGFLKLTIPQEFDSWVIGIQF